MNNIDRLQLVVFGNRCIICHPDARPATIEVVDGYFVVKEIQIGEQHTQNESDN